jgi:hypothetical protein
MDVPFVDQVLDPAFTSCSRSRRPCTRRRWRNCRKPRRNNPGSWGTTGRHRPHSTTRPWPPSWLHSRSRPGSTHSRALAAYAAGAVGAIRAQRAAAAALRARLAAQSRGRFAAGRRASLKQTAQGTGSRQSDGADVRHQGHAEQTHADHFRQHAFFSFMQRLRPASLERRRIPSSFNANNRRTDRRESARRGFVNTTRRTTEHAVRRQARNGSKGRRSWAARKCQGR